MAPAVRDFFPPTPEAYRWISIGFSQVWAVLSLASWTPLRHLQSMGKTSRDSRFNLPGRYAWAGAEIIGPANLLFILYTLPGKLRGLPPPTGIFGTGLPIQCEVMGMMYVVHYINRAIVTPLFLAPSMSPINPMVSLMMASFQFVNSSCVAGWLCYTAVSGRKATSLLSLPSVVGLSLFITGLAGNIIAETTLFDLRRGAAKRKAKSEGRATITYDKVYVIPPAEGFFKYVLHPHYLLEWLEWTGYWILGGAWGFGWGYGRSAALWFVVSEVLVMAPRAWTGLEWYKSKFGPRSVAGRKAVIPGVF